MADEVYKQISGLLQTDGVKFTVSHMQKLYSSAINHAESHQGDKRAYAMSIVTDVLNQLREANMIKATEVDNIIHDAIKYGPIAIDLAVAGSKGLLAINKKTKCCW